LSKSNHCSRCGKVPLSGFVGPLCIDCWKEGHPQARQETLEQIGELSKA
jgi:hypothetical protein